MEASFKTRFFFVMLVTGALAVAQGEVQKAVGKASDKPTAGGDVLMKCFYTPAADAQSSSLPTYPVGFKFSLMRNNKNQISVDSFSLNDTNQPIKQIGHAELTGGEAIVSASSTASALLSNLQLSPDSPFEFAISYLSDSRVDGVGTRFPAIVDDVTLFTGESFTALNVQCKMAPEKVATLP